MVSGIGPAAVLQEHDIVVLSDVPGVGQNEWVRTCEIHVRHTASPNNARINPGWPSRTKLT